MSPKDNPQPARAEAGLPKQALSYDGRIGELYGIFLLNLLLTVVTLGIYRPWAVTRMRRYVWSRTSFQGDRFEYTGTGLEMFLGYLAAIAILFGLYLAFAVLVIVASLISRPLEYAVISLSPTFAILAFAGIFSAQRYRLSRTLWHGIRGGMRGSALAFGSRAFLYLVAVILTLSLGVPWMTVRLFERRINASSFGNLAFNFVGRARRLYRPYLVEWVTFFSLTIALLAIVYHAFGAPIFHTSHAGRMSPEVEKAVTTLLYGLVAGFLIISLITAVPHSFYAAALAREVADNTSLGPLRFSCRVSGWTLLSVSIGNLLILLFTLGLGYPIVIQRNARLLAESLLVSGEFDPATLRQNAEPGSEFGEGLSQAFGGTGGLL
ncbi:MAG: YjgN family protein [Candidatus Methylacidiphilaceae bacterium]